MQWGMLRCPEDKLNIIKSLFKKNLSCELKNYDDYFLTDIEIA